jgi:PAS domain-containing protein
VTEQVRAQEGMVKFKALADASQDLIAIADNDGNATYLNPRIEAIGLQFSPEDLWKTIAEQAGDATAAEMRDTLKAGGRWSGEAEIRVDDEATLVHAQAFPLLRPGDGARLGTAWIAQDVTELRASAAALRAANADLVRFQALVEASRDFIAIADLDGTVRYVNPAGRELIGIDDYAETTIADYLTPEGIEASVRVEQPAVLAHGPRRPHPGGDRQLPHA